MLQQTFENLKVQDTVVISGWKDNTPSAKKEFDFLIISLPVKAIIHIEVKRTLNKKSKESATKQLNDGHLIMGTKVPFLNESNWKYIQYICFSHKNANDEEINELLKSNAEPGVTVSGTQIGDWCKDLASQMTKDLITEEVQAKATDIATYLNILKYLFHQMFIQEDVLTQGKFLLWTIIKAFKRPILTKVIKRLFIAILNIPILGEMPRY